MPRNRVVQRSYDRHLYKDCNLVERFFNWIKQFRRIATRYEKLARNYKPKNQRGASGIHKAFQDRHADVIRAMAEVLRLIPVSDQLALLEAKNDKGASGLFVALISNHGAAITAFGSLLGHVDGDARAKLLAAKRDNGTLALALAVEEENWEAVEAYLAVVKSQAPKLVGDAQETMLAYLTATLAEPDVDQALRTAPSDLYQKMLDVKTQLTAS